MRSHNVPLVKFPKPLILKLFAHCIPARKSDTRILTIVSPEIIDVTSLLPVFEFILIERMGGVLGRKEPEIVWKLRVKGVVLEKGIIAETDAEPVLKPQHVAIILAILTDKRYVFMSV